MVERFEKHYKITENVDVNNAISVAISYNKGGTNLFTYNHEKRGWYFSITPCTIERRGSYSMISTMAFSGYKMLIREIGRNSQKAYDEAVKFMQDNQKEYLALWFPDLKTEWEEV